MKTPVWIGYATNRHNAQDIETWQQEFWMHSWPGSPTQSSEASIRLEDDDNVMRKWPVQPRDLPPFMPAAMSGRESASGLSRKHSV